MYSQMISIRFVKSQGRKTLLFVPFSLTSLRGSDASHPAGLFSYTSEQFAERPVKPACRCGSAVRSFQ